MRNFKTYFKEGLEKSGCSIHDFEAFLEKHAGGDDSGGLMDMFKHFPKLYESLAIGSVAAGAGLGTLQMGMHNNMSEQDSRLAAKQQEIDSAKRMVSKLQTLYTPQS